MEIVIIFLFVCYFISFCEFSRLVAGELISIRVPRRMPPALNYLAQYGKFGLQPVLGLSRVLHDDNRGPASFAHEPPESILTLVALVVELPPGFTWFCVDVEMGVHHLVSIYLIHGNELSRL